MGDESGEKTEEPSSKKIDDSRKKGQVWKSKDLTGVAVFLTGMGVVKVMWPLVQSELKALFDFSFERLAHPVDLENATYQLMFRAIGSILLLSMPVALAGALVGGLSDFLQVGPLLSPEAVMPKLDKLNPIAGLKNMFGKKQVVELLKSMIKISITAYVVYGVVLNALPMVVGTIRADVPMTLTVLGELVYRVSVRVGIVFLGFAVFDVWFQHRSYMKDLMMTKEEVKREYKESEGDPHHKAKRKELHQEILEGAQMEAVKDASVVVTNPDHVAVALKYDRDSDQAPKVICKGLDSKAEKIKAIARSANVVMMRNVPLAHALYRVEIGQDIPEELYDAVAEALNFVYGLKAPPA